MIVSRALKSIILPAALIAVLAVPLAPNAQSATTFSSPGRGPWETLPFTAREWARQALLPYRRIPLKNGGSISVQDAYDLYLKAGQPEYPDMDTPGLVSSEEIAQQVKLGNSFRKP